MKRIWILIGVVFLLLISFLSIQYTAIQRYKEELNTQILNVKALTAQNEGLDNQTQVLQLSIDELEYSKDSLLKRIDILVGEGKIKDKNIRELQYQLSEASRRDTIVFRDTLFRDPLLQIDTLYGDEWYKVNLSLRYPSTIAVNPSFKSERLVTMGLERQTVKPPKKCWLARLFQRKHDVMIVEIQEKNPYIDIKEERYIKVVD